MRGPVPVPGWASTTGPGTGEVPGSVPVPVSGWGSTTGRGFGEVPWSVPVPVPGSGSTTGPGTGQVPWSVLVPVAAWVPQMLPELVKLRGQFQFQFRCATGPGTGEVLGSVPVPAWCSTTGPGTGEVPGSVPVPVAAWGSQRRQEQVQERVGESGRQRYPELSLSDQRTSVYGITSSMVTFLTPASRHTDALVQTRLRSACSAGMLVAIAAMARAAERTC